jgi:hypothetical protein
VPVAVELRRNAEPFIEFEHPERALYVFGPEDGSLGRAVLAQGFGEPDRMAEAITWFGPDWLHYRGEDPAGPFEILDTGHDPVLNWRLAAAGCAGTAARAVRSLGDLPR